jgi:hypothetical protein
MPKLFHARSLRESVPMPIESENRRYNLFNKPVLSPSTYAQDWLGQASPVYVWLQ